MVNNLKKTLMVMNLFVPTRTKMVIPLISIAQLKNQSRKWLRFGLLKKVKFLNLVPMVSNLRKTLTVMNSFVPTRTKTVIPLISIARLKNQSRKWLRFGWPKMVRFWNLVPMVSNLRKTLTVMILFVPTRTTTVIPLISTVRLKNLWKNQSRKCSLLG